jgi:hypothetical protein
MICIRPRAPARDVTDGSRADSVTMIPYATSGGRSWRAAVASTTSHAGRGQHAAAAARSAARLGEGQ